MNTKKETNQGHKIRYLVLNRKAKWPFFVLNGMMMMMMMINFISVSGLLVGHVRPTNRGQCLRASAAHPTQTSLECPPLCPTARAPGLHAINKNDYITNKAKPFALGYSLIGIKNWRLICNSYWGPLCRFYIRLWVLSSEAAFTFFTDSIKSYTKSTVER